MRSKRRGVVATAYGAATGSSRLVSIDWVRGLAVLIMIQAHATDAWTAPAERATTAFRYLTVLGGFAAPLFLWLAGLSLVLSGESILRKTGSVRRIWPRLVQRGLEIFVLAFLFRASAFLFNPGGAALTLFRVDILNVMGPALVVVGLLWGAFRSPASRLVAFTLLAVAVAMFTPVVRVAAWVDLLPTWLQWYVRPSGEHTVFTLFPWTGFVFAGAASGVVFSLERPLRSDVGVPWMMTAGRIRVSVCLAGLAVVAIGLITGLQPSIYRQSSYWTSSPAFFAVRSGVVLLALATADWAAALLRSWSVGGQAGAETREVRLNPLSRLGRASLLIYWIHVQIAYGWVTWPLHKQLNLSQLAIAYVVFCGAMYALVSLRDRLRLTWQTHRRFGSNRTRAASA